MLRVATVGMLDVGRRDEVVGEAIGALTRLGCSPPGQILAILLIVEVVLNRWRVRHGEDSRMSSVGIDTSVRRWRFVMVSDRRRFDRLVMVMCRLIPGHASSLSLSSQIDECVVPRIGVMVLARRLDDLFVRRKRSGHLARTEARIDFDVENVLDLRHDGSGVEAELLPFMQRSMRMKSGVLA